MVDALAGDDILLGEGGDDSLVGGDSSDLLDGLDGNDTLAGAGGDDSLIGGAGNDQIDGGIGIDAAIFATTVTLAVNGFAWTADDGAGTDTLFGVEIVEAGGTRTLLVGSGGFTSIQAAVEAAQDGDTILIADGIYVEQVTITTPNLTLRGQSEGGVSVRAPTAPAVQGAHAPWAPYSAVAAVVAVIGTTGVNIESLTVDGDRRLDEAVAAGADDFFGILYLRSSGAVAGVTVQNVIGDDGFFSVQAGEGIGVLADYDVDTPNPTTGTQTFSLTDSTIGNFQKTGLLVYNTVLTATGNTITGVGPTPDIAQNGMQLSRDTTGTVSGNSITGIGYNGAATSSKDASAIIVTDSTGDLLITSNTLSGTTADDDTAVFLLDSKSVVVTGNTIASVSVAIADFDDPAYGANFDPASLNTVAPNTFGDVGTYLNFDPGADATAAFAVLGTAADDHLFGGVGDDTLGGSAGQDALTGRGGNDTYRFDGNQTIVEAAGDGFDTVLATADVDGLATNVEALTLLDAVILGYGNDSANTITGNAANNQLSGFGGRDMLLGGAGKDTLIGGDGDDTLDGGTDNDAMTGGNGNDTYSVDLQRDTVIETGTTGIDLIIASASYTIARVGRVENLTLSGTAKAATGNDLANVITGNNANNKLIGGLGNDTLIGGVSRDSLTGGSGGDIFRFGDVDESGNTTRTSDLITDFDSADRIDLAGIDALAGDADDPFQFIGTAAFTAAGQVRYETAGGQTQLQLNLIGTGTPEVLIRLNGIVALDAGDFIL